MSEIINIYCDESCHLLNDRQKLMILGAVWCPLEKKQEIFSRIKDIKIKYNLGKEFEIKWTKVSPGRLDFYMEVLDYFFDDDDLHFRALIVPDKSKLDHSKFEQTHDDFYYKMYFDMLKVILNPDYRYRIYLDYKDTQAGQKVKHLHNVLSNNIYDFDKKIIERVQVLPSHEIQLIQLADLLIGIISFLNRGLDSSQAKLALINRMRQRSKYSLKQTTLLLEQKINLFFWHQRGVM